MAIGMTAFQIGELPQLGAISGIWDYAKYSNGFAFQGGIGYKPGTLIRLNIIMYSKDGRLWEHISPNHSGLPFRNKHTWIKKGGKSYIAGGYDLQYPTTPQSRNWEVTGYPPKSVYVNDDLPNPTAEHVTVISKGKAWVLGGEVSGASDQVYSTSDFVTFDAGGAEQKMPIPLKGHMIAKSGGKYYVYGGRTTGGAFNDKLWEVSDFSDVANWTDISSVGPGLKLAYGSMVIGAGWMHVFGGFYDVGGGNIQQSASVISNRLSDGMQVQEGMPGPRSGDCVFKKNNTTFIMVSGHPLDKGIYEFNFSTR